jgi:hypothetical protein
MRISTDDAARERVPFVSLDRGSVLRLLVAVTLGAIALVAPHVAPTAAEMTGNDETVVTFTTSGDFGTGDPVVTPPEVQDAPEAHLP